MKRVFFSLIVSACLACVACEDDTVPSEPSNDPPHEEDQPSDTLRVPGDYATIQEALDAADSGATVIVADGVYRGPGNFDLRFYGKAVKLASENGPASTIIDCEGDTANVRVGFYLKSNETSATIIEGVTVRRGYYPNGAAAALRNSDPVFLNCVFEGNSAYASGGAVHCKSASPAFVNCTFVGNSAPVGSAVFCIAGASPTFESCIVAYGTGGAAVYCTGGICQPVLVCSNVYGNAAGNWVDCLEGQADAGGNMSVDPMFCGAADGDHYLQVGSPCLAANNSCGELIGALGMGCTVSPPADRGNR